MARENKPEQQQPAAASPERGINPGTTFGGTGTDASSTAQGGAGATAGGGGAPTGGALRTAGPLDVLPGGIDTDDPKVLKARIAQLESMLGAAAATGGTASNPQAPQGKHRYRVTSPGGVKYFGTFYRQGQEIEAPAADAQGLDELLEYVGPIFRSTDTEQQRKEKEEQGERERQRMATSRQTLEADRRRQQAERERLERLRESREG